jgi:WD40 repeat protein
MPVNQRQATLKSLPRYLADALQVDRLQLILRDFEFLQAKINYIGIQDLIEDYDLIHPLKADLEQIKILQLIQSAISLSENILDEDKTQLAGQLLGRLLSFDIPEIQAMLEQAKQQKPKQAWLRPLTSSLTPPGEPLLRTFTSHDNWVRAVAITRDGEKIVSASEDGTLKIWNLNSGIAIKTIKAHDNYVTAVALTPDGKRAISASFDQTLKVWDIETGQALFTLIGHTKILKAVAITPDGKQVISGAIDGTLKIWDLNSGKEIKTLTGHSKPINAIAIAPEVLNVEKSPRKSSIIDSIKS